MRGSFIVGLLVIGSALFSGCASSVSRDATMAPTGYKLSANQKVSEVKLTISAEAQEKIKDNLKFDQDELRRHVERALGAYSLLDGTKKGELPVVEIVVTSVRVRSNFSAVMWGFMAGNDNISGDIVIKDGAGKVLDRFHVSASYALGGFAGGQDDARMGWLYEAFAKQAAEELTGTKK